MKHFVRFWAKRILKDKSIFLGNLILIILITIPLVCGQVFVNSMINGITAKYIYLSDGHISYSSTNELDISQDANIISADPVEKLYCVIYSQTATANVSLKGVGNNYFTGPRAKEISFEADAVEKDRLNTVYISKTLADKLSLKVGDKMAMMLISSKSQVVRPVIVQISRIYSTGYEQLDANLIFTNYEYAKSLSKATNYNYEIICNTNSVNKLTSIGQLLQRENRDSTFTTWDEQNKSVYENFVNSQQIISIIFALIIIMACFYSANVAHSTVQKNLNSIALMKMLGASNKKIKHTVFLSVFSITILGILIGNILGIVLSFSLNPLLYYLSAKGIEAFSFYLLDFSLTIPWLRLLLFAIFMLIVSSLSVLYSLRIVKNISPLQLFQRT